MMTTTTPWSDTPPSEPGWYHCKPRDGKDERPCYRHREFFVVDGVILMEHEAKAMYQFGPRVLSAEETVNLTAEVERLRQTLREYCDDDEVSSGFGSGCYSRRQIDEIRKRHGLDTESEGA